VPVQLSGSNQQWRDPEPGIEGKLRVRWNGD
jgi:hypothetical protein